MNELEQRFKTYLQDRIKIYEFFSIGDEHSKQVVIQEIRSIIDDFDFFVKVQKAKELNRDNTVI